MDSTVGARIEALARQKGLPPGSALARLFGVSYETLRKWRSGATAPNRTKQALIAELLGVAPEVFMHGAGQAGQLVKPAPLFRDQGIEARVRGLDDYERGALEDAIRRELDRIDARRPSGPSEKRLLRA